MLDDQSTLCNVLVGYSSLSLSLFLSVCEIVDGGAFCKGMDDYISCVICNVFLLLSGKRAKFGKDNVWLSLVHFFYL